MQTGIWQGSLHRQDGNNIVFNFSVERKNNKSVWYIHNAAERLLVDSIRQHGDSLLIQMPFFASGFQLLIKNNQQLEGAYVKTNGAKPLPMRFTAIHGVSYRYAATASPLYDVTGQWETYFGKNKKKGEYAIGEFAQNKNGIVTGTFRTATGDYRYLEGRVNGDSLLLSGFDGGHAVLFSAKIKNDTTLSDGFVYSGATSKQDWTATKNNKAQLPDGYDMTKMR
ncbi:MAG: TlpA family protein disulfide reductase, partial [Bacteroidota bacterium]|nr:TlpA family protein disulfide reductase [Bacteroidota bacterium]